MKLLGSKITKDKNDENVPHLEVVELVLVHCNLVNNDYQQDSRIHICRQKVIRFHEFLGVYKNSNCCS